MLVLRMIPNENKNHESYILLLLYKDQNITTRLVTQTPIERGQYYSFLDITISKTYL